MTTPPPPPDDDARFWDKTSHKYSQSPISDLAGYQRTLDKTVSLLKPSYAVVELGCGTGSTAIHLAPHARSYLGTDISPGMINIAKAKIAPDSPGGKGETAEIPSGLSFRVATADTLAAETPRFDVAVGFNYLHLVRDVPATLGHVAALLAPGGLFVSKTPCLRDMMLGRVLLPVLPLARMVGLAPFVTGFSAGELRGMMEAAGFDVVEVEYHGSAKGDTRPYVVARKREG